LCREAGLSPEPRLEAWASAAIRLALTPPSSPTTHPGASAPPVPAETRLDQARWSIVADLSRTDIANLEPL
ncbi:MAG TPA: hypothetical protein PK095_13475, partial [Myxococcota bacterium]|nr:hypothetical protein [Myxococcota bacterium]